MGPPHYREHVLDTYRGRTVRVGFPMRFSGPSSTDFLRPIHLDVTIHFDVKYFANRTSRMPS